MRGPDGEPIRAVYKPTRGERPLDDFPAGTLAARELAAFVLSNATGWGIVPPTVVRDGPFGPGMLQAWVEADPGVDVVRLVNESDPRLRRLALFDVIVNNADRKAGHLLPLSSGVICGVDHGICFAVAPKLRTVLWAWRGEQLDEAELGLVDDVAAALAGTVGDQLAELLTAQEVAATRRRTDELRRSRRFPQPDPWRPAIPWPPY
ncbi:MAG: SCO1664 family protein [Chloroflexota bacterium]|nr:SCO1664 family protein [Chloroflexota bacterium]